MIWGLGFWCELRRAHSPSGASTVTCGFRVVERLSYPSSSKMAKHLIDDSGVRVHGLRSTVPVHELVKLAKHLSDPRCPAREPSVNDSEPAGRSVADSYRDVQPPRINSNNLRMLDHRRPIHLGGGGLHFSPLALCSRAQRSESSQVCSIQFRRCCSDLLQGSSDGLCYANLTSTP